ncbi:unnamed protein product, partial [marine sediment metagenome]
VNNLTVSNRDDLAAAHTTVGTDGSHLLGIANPGAKSLCLRSN